MRAITLTQPWATMHVAPCALTMDRPAKQIESRGWKIKVPDGGLTLAIHAAKGIKAAEREVVSDGRRFREPYARYLIGAGYSSLDPWQKGYSDNFWPHVSEPGVFYSDADGGAKLKPLPLGAIVGRVTYSEIISGREVEQLVDDGKHARLELFLGFYDESDSRRWGWIGTKHHALDLPITAKGAQGIWITPEWMNARLLLAGAERAL